MNSSQQPVLVAEGLGWPEGPTIRPDGSVIFVECYRSQLTVVGSDGEARQFAYVTGGAEFMRPRGRRRTLYLPEWWHGRPVASGRDERPFDPEGARGG